MERAGRHLGLSDATIAELVSPQEVRAFRIPCKILGKVIVLWGVLALHNNARGPFKGGIRLAADVSLWETVELARLMTLKTAAVDIEFGGGKTGLRVDMAEMYRVFGRTPIDREFEKIISLDAVEYYAKAVGSLFAEHHYVPAPDMGTGPDEMAFIYNETQDSASVTGKPEGTPGWQPGRREATGYGVSYVTLRLLEDRLNVPAKQASVAIQGFGNVGSYAARYLADAGVRVVGVTDSYGGTCRTAGLDIPALVAHVGREGTVRGFAGGDPLQSDRIFALDVDVLIPAATGHVITDANAGDIRARAVVEGANMPTTMEAMDILTRRGIVVMPDIVANSGGVIASMEEYARSLSAAKMPQERMFQTIRDLLSTAMDVTSARSDELKVTLTEAAVGIAIERVYDAMRGRRMI
jgi:glutamate dehydrogenase/leucine dehydrogenase